MADQVLMRVPLHLQLSAKEGTPADEASQIRSGDIVGVLKQVNESCAYYQREGARRVVCKVTVLHGSPVATELTVCVRLQRAHSWPRRSTVWLSHIHHPLRTGRVLDES